MSEEEKKAEIEKKSEEKVETKISPNLYQDIISLKKKNIYLISESFEQKIPEILSYLLSKSAEYPIANKIQILIYLQDLIKKVDFHAEFFSTKKSLNENLNIFQVIINQIITCNEKELDYIKELKNTFILLLNKITLDRKTFKYIFSFLINYLNKDEQKLNSGNISRILDLLNIFYTNIQKISEKDDFIYFNNTSKEGKDDDYLIKIQNKDNMNRKKILNVDDSLNILLFIKLIPNELIKKEQPEHISGLLELDFLDKTKNISFNIDNDYNLIINNSSKDKISKLEENKYINILFKFNFKESFKIDIYINTKKVEFKNDPIEIKDSDKAKIKEILEINSINLFKNFIGQCSNIIIFRDRKQEGIPKFFTFTQKTEIKQKPKANTISALFDMSAGKQEKIYKEEIIMQNDLIKGLCNEELLNILLKHELSDEVEQNYLNNIFKNSSLDKIPLVDISQFYEKIIAIYTPNRFEFNSNNKENIILKDSINGLDAVFENKKNKNSDLNGIHIYNNPIKDFNALGDLNIFIPIIEILINSENLLTNENLQAFFNLISTIINPSYKDLLKNEKNNNFFSNLAFFFEKINEKFFISDLADNIINLSKKIVELISDDDLKEIIQDFQNFIFDEKLFYKFKIEDQNKIIAILNLFFSQKSFIVNVDIIKIINILLYYDRDKYTKFCCKEHSDYFNKEENKERKIMEPELCQIIQPIELILKSILKNYIEEPLSLSKDGKPILPNSELSKTEKDILSLFSVLTLGVSPCLEKSIIKIFTEVFEETIEISHKYENVLDKNGIFFDVCLFILKSSIFEYKSDIINLINLLIKIKSILTSRNKVKAKEVLPSVKISGPYEIFLNNNIFPFYLIPKEELSNIDENKITKIFCDISGNEFNYLTKTEIEKKIFTNYNKEKINPFLNDLYKSIFSSFKSNHNLVINLDFLIKITSKGDLNLILTFLQDLIKEKLDYNEIDKNGLLLYYLCETYFQSFMIKSTNFDKNKFVSRFYFTNETFSKK